MTLNRAAKTVFSAGIVPGLPAVVLTGIPASGKGREPAVSGIPAARQSALTSLAQDRVIPGKNGLSVILRDEYPDGTRLAGETSGAGEGGTDLPSDRHAFQGDDHNRDTWSGTGEEITGPVRRP